MYCNNKLENLAAKFCENIATIKSDPFEEDMVVSQSGTMELYLNKQLADSRDIAANITYPYPRKSIYSILKPCGITPLSEELSPEVLIWKIYALLPELESKYKVISQYIKHGSGNLPIRRYQLACTLSGVFDNYLGYRGDWLETWQRGENLSLGPHEEWQAELWRKMTVDAGEEGDEERISFERPSMLLGKHLEELKQAGLPKRVSIFGISNLPADFIEFFRILNDQTLTQVDIYYLMPCLEYWADSTKKTAFIEKMNNGLLVSWGRLGQDFFKMLLDNFENDLSWEPEEESAESKNLALLPRLQSDILYDLPEGASKLVDYDQGKLPGDNSLVINNCFSRMREVEVLHDHILGLLNTGEYKVNDIVVMAPNIEEYTPYIQAVFSKHNEGEQNVGSDEISIPFSIADCSPISSSAEAETFLKMLEIADSRATAQDIYDIIASEPVAAKFRFSPDDLSDIHDFILKSNIAWGKNNQHREQVLGKACPDLNTWEFGIKRLLAGYAFDCEGTVDDGTLPLMLKGDQGIILGEFLNMCNMIFHHSSILRAEHSPEEWQEALLAIINDLFQLPNSKNENLEPIFGAVNRLANHWYHAKIDDKLPLNIIRTSLQNELSQDSSSGRSAFFRGKLTFCRLLPMRNIPFKAVCVLGLNEGEFPRLDRKLGFDLASIETRPGDRSLRKDDRYIFLETLIACREKLYLSYIGQSIEDNEEIPPSILVAELLDYLVNVMKIQDKKEFIKSFVIKHPLHGFNTKYFSEDGKFYSFSKINCDAAKALQKEQTPETIFCPEELPFEEGQEWNFTFRQFVNFFISPPKFFLNHRLKINLYNEDVETLRDCEPFGVGTLENYQLKSEFLDHKLLDKSFELEKAKKAEGSIPYGFRGNDLLEQAEGITENLAEKISELGDRKSVDENFSLEYEIDGVPIKLVGNFDNLYEESQAFFRPSSIKIKDKIRAWIWHHLALEAGIDFANTKIIGANKDGTIDEIEISSKQSYLEELVKVVIKGLKKPLPLFIYSSSTFAEKVPEHTEINKEMEAEELTLLETAQKNALKTAKGKWQKSHANDFEYDLQDEENYFCFGDTSPVDYDELQDEFIELAQTVYGKMFVEGRDDDGDE